MELENMLKEFDESTKELQEELEKSIDTVEEEVTEPEVVEETTEEEVIEAPIEEEVVAEEVAEKSVEELVVEEEVIEEAEKSVETTEDIVEEVEKSAKEDDDKEEDEKDEKKEKPKKKKKKGEDDEDEDEEEEDEEEEDEEEEKEEAKKSTSFEDAEGLFKSILESYKASIAVNKNLLETNKALIKQMETLKEEVTKSLTFTGEAVAKSFGGLVDETGVVEEVEDKAVSYIAKSVDAIEESIDTEVEDIVIPEEAPAAPIFDADASREEFLDRFRYEAQRNNYSRGQLQSIKDDYLTAKEGKQISEAAQLKLKQFTEKA